MDRADVDTIAAISTPVGEGAIALIRISGPEAFPVADKVFQGAELPSEMPTHLQRFGHIRQGDELIDRVMLTVHRAPQSYTGEDLVEISCHGGMLVTARVLHACLRAGARPARPGEFTERAFHHGKMDLTQAEAVMDLIRAQSDLALRSATEQLQGGLGQSIGKIRDQLIELLAHIEASIDFPEEGIAPDQSDKLRQRLEVIHRDIDALLATAARGRILREGVRVVIYGATNAGKSSLLNRLLNYDRAIVNPKPGTTRDTIDEVVILGGMPVRLLDTAGLRDSQDEVEMEGMGRTRQALKLADLKLHVIDRSDARPSDFNAHPGQNELLLLNKSDLPEHADWQSIKAIRLSCVTGDGLGTLEEAIIDRLRGNNLGAQSAIAINTRHRDCLRRAGDAATRASETLAQAFSVEYAAVDLRIALAALGEVIGVVSNEKILDSVFGQFCIGK